MITFLLTIYYLNLNFLLIYLVEPDRYFAAAISWNRTCVVITDNPVSDVLGEKMKFHYKLGGAVSDKYPGDNDIKVCTP